MDRYRVIAKFAKQNNWKQGLELGVWVGVTTFYMMRETDVKMYCVDAWEEQPDNPEYDWQFNKKQVERWEVDCGRVQARSTGMGSQCQ